MIYTRLGRGQEGLELINQSLEFDFENVVAKSYRCMALLCVNEVDKAHAEYEHIEQYYNSHPRGKAVADIRYGNGEWLRHVADSLLQEADSSDYYLLSLLNGLKGDIDQAIYFFSKIVKARDANLMFVIEDPVWDPIRHHPEYKKAMIELSFPEDQPESFSDMLDRLYGPIPDR